MDDIYRTNICGVDISLRTTESTEYTDRIVETAREHIRAVMQEGNLSVHKAAMLACLGLCDEMTKLQAENNALKSDVSKLSFNLKRISDEKEAACCENKDLNEELLRLKIDLSNRK